MTADEVKEIIGRIKEEYKKALTAEEYWLRGDKVKKASLDSMLKHLKHWENELEVIEGRRSGIKVTAVVPVDV